MPAERRVANLEGLARARQTRPKKRRDTDAYLQEEFVQRIKCLGEGEDGEVGAEHVSDDDDMRGAAQTCASFSLSPIVLLRKS